MDVILNELKINGNGRIKSLENGYGLNIDFKAPSTDFKNILSLVPLIYQNEFEKVTATGSANFDGFVKGVYSDTTMPGYHIVMDVTDGSFKYTDLPKAIQQINFKAVVDNTDGQADNTVVDIKNGHLALDREPFDFRILVKNPVSNMYVDAAAKGKLNLSELSDYMKLDKGTSIAGIMNTDVAVKGNVKEIEKQQFNNFYAAGIVNVNNFSYVSKDYPTGVKINTLNAIFTPAKIDLSNLAGQYQKSNFNGGGQINNLLSYLLDGKPLSANLTINADKINLNDWMGVTTDTSGTAASSSVAGPFIVPANLDITLNTKIDKLLYDKIEIEQLSGILVIEDETVKLNNINGNALDGTIEINGAYSTKESKIKPAIALSYDVAAGRYSKNILRF